VLKHLSANFLITSQFYDKVSSNFQSTLRESLEYVACNEKLVYFTGNSGDVRKCPNKPGNIDLWFYQIVVLQDHRGNSLFVRHKNGLNS
jgi:hypothetical protein